MRTRTDPKPTKLEFVPALRFPYLTRFYDALLARTLKEDRFRHLLAAQVAPRPGDRVLDLGCGTATLTILLKSSFPDSTVIGLDADDQVLAIAKQKAAEAGIAIELRKALAPELPFEDGSFDRIVSSLFFHHLALPAKHETLQRALRLLRPHGEIHIADWGKAQNRLMRAAFLSVQLLDGFANTADHVYRGLAPFLKDAGFEAVVETHHEATLFGTLSLYKAVKP